MRRLRSLTELRVAVEPPAAAARHARTERRERVVELGELLSVTGTAGEPERFLELDIEFHAAGESGNEMFAGLSDVVAEVLAGRIEHALMPRRPRPAALRLHSLVALAVRDGLPEVAESAMRGITTEVVEALEAAERPVGPAG